MWGEHPVRRKSDTQIEKQITPNLAKLSSKLYIQIKYKTARL